MTAVSVILVPFFLCKNFIFYLQAGFLIQGVLLSFLNLIKKIFVQRGKKPGSFVSYIWRAKIRDTGTS